MNYEEFVASKLAAVPPCGFEPPRDLRVPLADFQADLVRWALRRGRASIFADTGLGKTRMQLAWAAAVAKKASKGARVLILAPLAVAKQTAAEGEAVGVKVTVCRDGADVRPGVNVTNYDRLHRFDPAAFCAVVLDESSCIKHHDTKTLAALLDAFRSTPYRLCCTATPAPNDWTELGTHAEFLGVCSRSEMLSEFFVHDGGETQVWRLKGHARSAFWRWVSSWGALVKSPADLGYDASRYALPALDLREHLVRSEWRPSDGSLFAEHAESLTQRRDARKQSVADRVAACAAQVAAEPGEPWVVWCDLNAEGDALLAAIPGAVEIRGSDDVDEKESRLDAFARGDIRVLVTKPSIAGFGLNWQHCARMAFVGVTDSWESYYQAVRRCWRFGQRRPVVVHIFASQAEGAVVANLRRKEQDAAELAASLAAETREAVRAEVRGTVRSTNDYDPQMPMAIPAWLAEGVRVTKKGYKQTPEHIARRIKRGSSHPNWKGDDITERSGRSRALRWFPTVGPCVRCGAEDSERHHKDGDTKNNEPGNIEALCRKCCHMEGDGRLAEAAERMRSVQPDGVAARWAGGK